MTANRRATDIVYAVSRVVIGLLFTCHGAQKLFGAFGGTQTTQGLMILAGVIEVAGGLLIAMGLMTRIAASLASGMMAAAYFMAHAPAGFWPIQNKGELAVVYCFVFLLFAAIGGGRCSLDHLIRSRKPAEHGLGEAAIRMANR